MGKRRKREAITKRFAFQANTKTFFWSHFTDIHRRLIRKIEKSLNSTITEFYNSDDVNATTAELLQIKTGPISFKMIDNLLYETKVTGGDTT